MRKIFSFITAVLFAGSMMAVDFTLSSDGQVTQEGVTVSFAKGSGSTAPKWYDNGLRLYAKNEVTISSATPITGVTFNWQKQGSKPFNTVSASKGNYSHPTSAGAGVWTGSATSVTFTLGDAGQLLLNTFSVTLNGEGGGIDSIGVDTIPQDSIPLDTLTPMVRQYEVAEAITAGLKDGTQILVRGVITKMQIKGKNFAKYGSVNIFVKDATGAEGEFEFFNCYAPDSAIFTTTTPAYNATSSTLLDLKKVADEDGNVIRLGDTVVALGKYLYYEKNNVYELNTGCYIVDIRSAPVPPVATIEVNMSEGLRYEDCVATEGWWQIYGEDDKFQVSISNAETTQAEGTYTIEDLDGEYTYLGIIDGRDTSYISFIGGSVTLSVAQNGDVTVAGQLEGDDDNLYNLNLRFVAPTAQTTVTVNIPDGELYDEFADYGLYVVYGEDENNVYVQLGIWVEEDFQGKFSEQDLDNMFVGSFIMEGEEEVEIYAAEITVTPGNGGDYNITASLLCFNNKQYNVTMHAWPTEEGIENSQAPKANSQKLIKNGQLIIEKAGRKYTVLGAEIR